MSAASLGTLSHVLRKLSAVLPNVVGLLLSTGLLAGWTLEPLDLGWLGVVGTWLAITLAIDRAVARRLSRLRGFGSWLPWAVAAAGTFAAVATWSRGEFHLTHLLTATGGAVLGWALRPKFVSTVRVSRSFGWEALRWLCILGCTAFVIRPYATRGLVGGGDAQHYAQQLADVTIQAQRGVFPFFVGQSFYAFNGDIHPLRTAPYFQYVGVAVDALTLHRLGPVGVLNLLIVGSLVAAGLIMYVLALRLGGRSMAWPALLLSIAFVSCPGVLALIYSGDMVASWLTLPFLPLVVYGLLRATETKDVTSPLLLVTINLAVLWLIHAPIALWVSFLAFLCIGDLVRRRWNRGRGLWIPLGAAVVGLALSAYIFVSVATLDIPNDPNLVKLMRDGGVIHALRAGWLGLMAPVDAAGADLLRNLQLSAVLWLVLALGLVGAWMQRRVNAPVWIYVGSLLVLLSPLVVTARLWAHMPTAVISITEKWPMQRFYPILSVVVPLAALAGLRAPKLNRPLARKILSGVLALGCLYSLVEARKFIRRGVSVTSSVAFTLQRLREENAVLSRYSYEYYGRLPNYFRHGPMSPLNQIRLLSADTLEIATSNLRLLLDPASTATRGAILHRFEKTDYGGRFVPQLHLEPGQIYLVSFDFGTNGPEGVLELTSPIIYRQYPISSSTESMAFSDGPGQQRGFSIGTSGPDPDDVEMRFYLTPGSTIANEEAVLRVIQVDNARLPLRLKSLIPYAAETTAATDGWLETPKIFTRGYAALVDGKETRVARSPQGLVMIPVSAGDHRIELTYPGPWGLRAAFWTTAGAWSIVFGFILLPISWRNRWRARRAEILVRIGKAGTVVAAGLLAAGGINYLLTLPAPPAELASSEHFTLRLSLPVDREKAAEIIATSRIQEHDIALVAKYVTGQHVVFGFLRDGAPWMMSAPVPVNYVLPHSLDVMWSTVKGAGKVRRFRLVLDHRVLVDRTLSLDAPPDGQDRKEAAASATPFSGKLHAADPVLGPPPPQSKEYAPEAGAL